MPCLSAHLQGALKRLGLPNTPEYVDQIMMQFGRNGSGKVQVACSGHSQAVNVYGKSVIPFLATPKHPQDIKQLRCWSAQVDAEGFYQYAAQKEERMWRTFQDLDIDGTGPHLCTSLFIMFSAMAALAS